MTALRRRFTNSKCLLPTVVLITLFVSLRSTVGIEVQRTSLQKKRFLALDVDENGKLSWSEYVDSAGKEFKSAAEREFAMFDCDENEELSFNEFCFTPRAELDKPSKFKRLDVDENQSLSLPEFLHPYSPANRSAQRLVFAYWDTDGDGELVMDEYAPPGNLEPAKSFLARFGALDSNANGTIGFAEYAKSAGEKYKADAEREFGQFDVDADGEWTLTESFAAPRPGLERPVLFRILDADHDRRLTRDEFLRICRPAVHGKQLAVFYSWDADGDQQVSPDEFLKQGQRVVLSLRNRFLTYDLDGDGHLSRDEYVHPQLGAESKSAAEREFATFDGDEDDQLSFDEFCFTPRAELGRSSKFERLDADEDRRVSLQEFLNSYSPANRPIQHLVFACWDGDGDGELVMDEYAPPGNLEPAKPFLARFGALDSNANGAISLAEYLTSAGEKYKADAEREFGQFDVDADGEWTLTESFAAPRPGLERPVLFRILDADHDRQLTCDEFLNSYSPANRPIRRLVFAYWDGDGDGELVISEYAPPGNLEPAKPFLARFGALDSNANGAISLAEYLASADEKYKADAEKEFDQFDVDADGNWTLTESFASPRPGLERPVLFRILDTDHDRKLTCDEFLNSYSPANRPIRSLVFAYWDGDGDGELVLSEYAPPGNLEPAKPFLARFGALDSNANGAISLAEYLASADEKYKADAEKEFDQFDVDADGTWTLTESFASPRPGLERPVLFRILDTDHDRKLTCDEFLRPCRLALHASQRAIFSAWDADGDQHFELDEFLKQGQGQGPGAVTSIRDKYLACDLDGDGRLSREEYVHPHLGGQWEKAARDESMRYDLDRDRFLSLLEFAMTPQGKFPSEEVFRLLDTDGDGFLNLTEVLQVRSKQQWPHAGAAFYRYDTNADGRLTLEEFLRLGTDDGQRPDALVAKAELLLVDVESACADVKSGSDGRVTAKSWPQQRIDKLAGDLAGIKFREWDRDGDGDVTASERRSLIEIAFGIRRTDGSVLRRPAGFVMTWGQIRKLDKNHDDALSREEYVSGQPDDPNSVKSFQEWDKDGDGRLTFAELALIPWIFADIYGDFCRCDANADGRVTANELLAAVAPWQKRMAMRLVPAFDLDGDQALGLDEFTMTPFANPLADWYLPPVDSDDDGRISWAEYYAERSPFLYAVARQFFLRFDRDRNGFLSRKEFDFPIDWENIPAEAALATLDADADGRLALKELIEPSPKSDDPTVLLRWQEKTMHVEEAFRAGDTDHDGALTLAEFGKQQASLAAAIQGKSAPSATARAQTGASSASGSSGEDSWNWRMIGLVAGNGLLLVGAAWMMLKRG